MGVNSIDNQKTIQQIIDQTASSKTSKRSTGELGKDEFLNLLVTQLQYQDPMNPQDDTQFIAQMAQFSALEQMQNLNTSYSANKAFGMIGKMVTANISEDSDNTKSITGEVASVKMQSGKAYVVVDGNDVLVEDVLEVKDVANENNTSNLSDYTGIIGYDCSGYVYDSDSGTIVGVNGVVKEVTKGTYENYAIMDGVAVDVSAVNTTFTSVNPSYMEHYLSNNKGLEVSLMVPDESGKEVAVKAILKDFSVSSNGRIKAVLDGVKVPVDSIVSIRPEETENENTGGSNNVENTGNGNEE